MFPLTLEFFSLFIYTYTTEMLSALKKIATHEASGFIQEFQL